MLVYQPIMLCYGAGPIFASNKHVSVICTVSGRGKPLSPSRHTTCILKTESNPFPRQGCRERWRLAAHHSIPCLAPSALEGKAGRHVTDCRYCRPRLCHACPIPQLHARPSKLEGRQSPLQPHQLLWGYSSPGEHNFVMQLHFPSRTIPRNP